MQPEAIDAVRLHFSPQSLWLLNFCLGFIIFGVALELKLRHFRAVLSSPKTAAIALTAQLVVMPLITLALIYIARPMPSMALGMILVAACPSGSVANFMSLNAKANAALSVSLTAMLTLLAPIITPAVFTFYGSLYPPAAQLMRSISVNLVEMFVTVMLVLGIPLLLGIFISEKYSQLAERISPFIKKISLLIFFGVIVAALAANFQFFLQYIHLVAVLVFFHNGLGFLGGYTFAKTLGMSEYDARTISIETGVHNTGLGLMLIFTFFGGMGGMAILAAWWGIWDMIAGLAISHYWGKRGIK
ncbi:MAG TPA: bile acid:sodium symporter family protein [Chitinophagales bacterium]|nr:bile acid:sodium symporter family protein [Chitinophagales bacterium]HRK28283.1 bile acid:sodium symporter family protein [Chitinophagales bacterium]